MTGPKYYFVVSLSHHRHHLITMIEPAAFSNFVFWFCVAGAAGACISHLLRPDATLSKLTPVAFHTSSDSKGNTQLSPEGRFWGGYAFAAVNFSYGFIGAWIGLNGLDEGKKGYLLGTGLMFLMFSLIWFTKGHTTGIASPVKQGTKVALFGLLFLAAYFVFPVASTS